MNPCLACHQDDGPRIVGPYDRPFVECECGARSPARKTVEAAVSAWNRLNPDDEKPALINPRSRACTQRLQTKAPWMRGFSVAPKTDVTDYYREAKP